MNVSQLWQDSADYGKQILITLLGTMQICKDKEWEIKLNIFLEKFKKHQSWPNILTNDCVSNTYRYWPRILLDKDDNCEHDCIIALLFLREKHLGCCELSQIKEIVSVWLKCEFNPQMNTTQGRRNPKHYLTSRHLSIMWLEYTQLNFLYANC